MSTTKKLERLLEETTIESLLPTESRLICVPSTATIKDALQILSSNKILSAPVEDASQTEIEKRYRGFIDMFDILSYAIIVCSENKQTSDGSLLHVWCQDINKLSYKGQEFANHPISSCIDLSKLDPFFTVNKKSTLPQLIYIFNKGMHRAAAVENGNVTHIISQSTVIQFLAKHIGDHKMAKATVEQIGFQNKKLFTVSSEARAIHAFFQMMNNKVSAIAITDKNGALVGNLSVSDLKGLTQENFADLLLSCTDYIRKYSNPQIPNIVTVKGSTTFEEILQKLSEYRIHRLWVTDDYDRPTGVISLTDVMRFMDLRIYIDQTEPLWEKDLAKFALLPTHFSH